MISRDTFPLLMLLLVALARLSAADPGGIPAAPAAAPARVAPGLAMKSADMPDVSMSAAMPAPTTTESTIDEIESFVSKAVDEVEHLIKKTILPSDPNAFIKAENDFSPTAGPPSLSIAANNSTLTTEGIVPEIEKLLRPIAQIGYSLFDSFLRAFENKSLPCVITSWVPLEGYCTPLVNTTFTDEPIPAPSGPQP